MPRLVVKSRLFALVIIALVACTQQTGDESATLADKSSPDASGDGSAVPRHVQEMRSVMQAKLLHSRQLLESIATEDAVLIEHHAGALTSLSRQSDWQIHDTAAYLVFSDRFRESTEDMAAHARAGNLEAVSDDYAEMAATCIACHDYLRQEGLVKDLPGSVAWLGRDR